MSNVVTFAEFEHRRKLREAEKWTRVASAVAEYWGGFGYMIEENLFMPNEMKTCEGCGEKAEAVIRCTPESDSRIVVWWCQSCNHIEEEEDDG